MARPLDGSDSRPKALVTYLRSLAQTRELPAEILLPGHGEPITDHVALIEERFAMHRRRAEKLRKLIAERPGRHMSSPRRSGATSR
jgi:glyoxylase-like metal-dependent hydrolase (beta-lactamase superfamily II)